MIFVRIVNTLLKNPHWLNLLKAVLTNMIRFSKSASPVVWFEIILAMYETFPYFSWELVVDANISRRISLA